MNSVYRREESPFTTYAFTWMGSWVRAYTPMALLYTSLVNMKVLVVSTARRAAMPVWKLRPLTVAPATITTPTKNWKATWAAGAGDGR